MQVATVVRLEAGDDELWVLRRHLAGLEGLGAVPKGWYDSRVAPAGQSWAYGSRLLRRLCEEGVWLDGELVARAKEWVGSVHAECVRRSDPRWWESECGVGDGRAEDFAAVFARSGERAADALAVLERLGRVVG